LPFNPQLEDKLCRLAYEFYDVSGTWVGGLEIEALLVDGPPVAVQWVMDIMAQSAKCV